MRLLALSILDGGWDRSSLTDRLERARGGGPPAPERLASRRLFHFDDGQAPARRRLTEFLKGEEALRERFGKLGGREAPAILLDPPVMGRLPDNMLTLPLAQLPTEKDLLLWLGLHDHELCWFADSERRQCRVRESRLHHYRYQWTEKRSGAPRLIEIPKTRLKAIQRRILGEILNRVPSHTSAHGFIRGRSCRSFVAPHVGKPVVIRMDLKDFFHSVPVARIGALFRRLGYPPAVARLLQDLCTHTTSAALAGERFGTLTWAQRKRLADKHLPQGAPTSPALANLCAWRFDCRLQGIAQRFDLDYTRYADDIALSGDAGLIRLAPFLQSLVGAIALEEGFEINHRKTRVRTRAQSQRLAGMVINQKTNPPRGEFDALKAILHNCVRHGPTSQNRQGRADFKAHLAGRIAYVNGINPAKGARLKVLWSLVKWTE
ncbi:MAG: reverse transcriptase family protein [Candidatus Thiodiazotropha sp.]